jgi:hypothetical protein
MSPGEGHLEEEEHRGTVLALYDDKASLSLDAPGAPTLHSDPTAAPRVTEVFLAALEVKCHSVVNILLKND